MNLHDDKVKKRRVDNSDNTDESKIYLCVCTCCHENNLRLCHFVIFIKKNYKFDNHTIAETLSRRQIEVRNKEFICKPCHNKLNDGKFLCIKFG